MITLVPPQEARAPDYRELCAAYAAADGSVKHAMIDSDEKARARIRSDLSKDADGQPDGRPRTVVRWAVDGDGRLVGSCRIRLWLNKEMERVGGHIGYDVHPGHRRKGYATAILGDALAILRSRGVDKALVTCDDDNPGSAGTIERNGGILEGLETDPETGKPVRRYWIET